jgi:hypothetical protein
MMLKMILSTEALPVFQQRVQPVYYICRGFFILIDLKKVNVSRCS